MRTPFTAFLVLGLLVGVAVQAQAPASNREIMQLIDNEWHNIQSIERFVNNGWMVKSSLDDDLVFPIPLAKKNAAIARYNNGIARIKAAAGQLQDL